MSTSTELLELLRRDQAHSMPEELKSWRQALKNLFAQLRSWLESAVKEDLVKVDEGAVDRAEPDLGLYSAPTLAIKTARGTVDVIPAGRFVAGYVISGVKRITGLRGRVDLICGGRRAAILRARDGNWLIVPPRDLADIPLSHDNFHAVLSDLLR